MEKHCLQENTLLGKSTWMQLLLTKLLMKKLKLWELNFATLSERKLISTNMRPKSSMASAMIKMAFWKAIMIGYALDYPNLRLQTNIILCHARAHQSHWRRNLTPTLAMALIFINYRPSLLYIDLVFFLISQSFHLMDFWWLIFVEAYFYNPCFKLSSIKPSKSPSKTACVFPDSMPVLKSLIRDWSST